MKKLIILSIILFAACKKDKNVLPDITPGVQTKFCYACTEKLGSTTAEYDKCNMTDAEIKAYTDAGAHVIAGGTITCVKKQ